MIGIDETSYKKGHFYLTTVVNQKTCEVIWACDRHGKEVLSAFFEQLSDTQISSIQMVSGDGARWIKDTVKHYARSIQNYSEDISSKKDSDKYFTATWKKPKTAEMAELGM